MSELPLHIVYLRSGDMLITRKAYAHWREIQDAFEEYMASLGPWPPEAVLAFLREEYPTGFTQEDEERLQQFLRSDDETIVLAAG